MAIRSRVIGGKSVGRTVSRAAVNKGAGLQADGRETAAKRGYTSRWSKASRTLLAHEPICKVSIAEMRMPRPSEVVDHLYPHCRLRWLFWERKLWVPMAKAYHDGPKQRIEQLGELAIDELAFKLGLPTLAQMHPDRVDEWRNAMRERGNGGVQKSWR